MMTLDSRLAAPLAHALGRALAHFLWQGALLAAALWVALFIGAGRTARWRHHAAMACLLAMPLAFGATVAVLLGGRPGTVQPPLAPRMIFNSVIPQGTPAAPVDRLAWLAPLWLAGVILFYSFRLAGWLRVDSLRRRGVCAAPPEWQQRLLALAAAVRVSRPVVLLESCMAGVPQVIGYWRPVIRSSIDKFLKCGDLKEGFARVRCKDCGEEFFVAFSCRQRSCCPSCDRKRSLLLAHRLKDEVLAAVPHRHS